MVSVSTDAVASPAAPPVVTSEKSRGTTNDHFSDSTANITADSDQSHWWDRFLQPLKEPFLCNRLINRIPSRRVRELCYFVVGQVRQLNFIKIHYLYILMVVIIGSIIIYPNQNIRYIDALFFATSACTQGGLNPVDVNLLNTWQQVVLYLLPMITTPIFINTCVVFVRLYYFEKEFYGIRARSKLESKYRRTLTRSRTIARGEEPEQSVPQKIFGSFKSKFKGKMNVKSDKSEYPLPLSSDLNKDTVRNTLSNMNANMRNGPLPQGLDSLDLESGIPQQATGDVSAKGYGDSQEAPNLHVSPPPLSSRAISFNDPFRPSKPYNPEDSPTAVRRASLTYKSRQPSSDGNDQVPNLATRDIKFGPLPHPTRNKRQNTVQPSDIARSISLMENRNRGKIIDDDDEGPALVIRRPQDIEQEEEMRAQRQKRQSHRQHRGHGRKNYQYKGHRNSRDYYSHERSSNSHHQKHEDEDNYDNQEEEKEDDQDNVHNNSNTLSRAENPEYSGHALSEGYKTSNISSSTYVADSAPPSATVFDPEYTEDAIESSDEMSLPQLRRSATHNPQDMKEKTEKVSFGEETELNRRSQHEGGGESRAEKMDRRRAHSLDGGSKSSPMIRPGLPRAFSSFKRRWGEQGMPLSLTAGSTLLTNQSYSYDDNDNDDLASQRSIRSRAVHRRHKSRSQQYFLSAPTRTMTMDSDSSQGLGLRVMSSNYLSWTPDVEGNSVFLNLTHDQKNELGGVEYRALKILAKILVMYYVGWHVIALVIFTPWGLHSESHKALFEEIAVHRGWWGVFTAASSFNNLGLTLTPSSMADFSSSIYVLIFTPFFMIIGNTGFPVFLRFTIWVMFKLTDPYGRMHESLGFLLDHPRRCFTLLFPSGPTWWLFGVVVALNVIDTVLFLILDLSNEAVIIIPVGYRIMSGLFQAVATRTTGFGILNIGQLHPAVLVSYTIMMYINIFPVAMSVRHTNVYEEQTLGLYRAPTALRVNGSRPATIATLAFPPDSNKAKKISDVSTHLMRQLSYDLWFMFIALFIVCISDGGKVTRPTDAVPIFNMLFEVTSAYGTVGLSTGYPNSNTSLSGHFSVIGKLVIIGLLYRGRHRSLPYAIDRAIILPSKTMEEDDKAQEAMVSSRRNTDFGIFPRSFTDSTTMARFNSNPTSSYGYADSRESSMSSASSSSSDRASSSSSSEASDQYGMHPTSSYQGNLTRTFSTGSRRAFERNAGTSLRTNYNDHHHLG